MIYIEMKYLCRLGAHVVPEPLSSLTVGSSAFFMLPTEVE